MVAAKAEANRDGAVAIPSWTRDRGRTQIEPRVFQAVPDLSRGAFHDNLPIVLQTFDGGVEVADLSEIDFERFVPLLDSQRLMYDECQTSTAVRQSTSPIGYVLDTSTYVSCNPSMVMGVVGGNTSSRAADRGSFVDIENDLQNRSRPMSRACPDQQPPAMEPNGLKHLATRKLYEQEYTQQLDASVGVGSYLLAQPKHCATQVPDDPRLRAANRSRADTSIVDVVDLESQMRYRPSAAPPPPSSDPLPPPAGPSLAPTEDTRLSNPPSTLRSTGVNRWQWLCKNPQDSALTRFDHNVASRIVVKDNHRPVIPTVLDQSRLLPPRPSDVENPTIEAFEGGGWRSCAEYKYYQNGSNKAKY
ncbi:hypothetical protein FOA52_007635 [Chlamydomonas sp. UWO 241]|nr:hypothetical protein FOA52_007635 [Chlamydomonas sp. UWO 241]